MNLHPDLSFVAMMVQASVVVQAVMALLFLASLWSWWQIFLKLFTLKRATRDTDRFEDDFWKGGDLNELFQRASQNLGGALERVFSSGFREYAKHRRQGTSSAATMDSARRAMRLPRPPRGGCAQLRARWRRHGHPRRCRKGRPGG